MRILLLSARRADFTFEEAWNLAATTILGHMNHREAGDWFDVIAATRTAWADAYEDRPSRLASLAI